MSRLKLLRRDERGAAVIEFAIAVPVLILFIYGIFRIGLLFQANAGMQHALGEGARYATLYPKPADNLIVTKMTNEVFGMKVGTFGTPTVTTPSTATCTNCRELTVTFSITPDFLFFSGPVINLTRSKRVYTAAP